MSSRREPATRMALVRARRRQVRVATGAAVLRRKREALITELFKLARPAADTRARIAETADLAYRDYRAALALHGAAALGALAWPSRDVEVEIAPISVWGIKAATVTSTAPVRRSVGARGVAPGLTGPAALGAAERFEELTDLLLGAASREILIRRLGDALSTTSRQVHTLERRVAPELADTIAQTAQALDEREREERTRLRHILRVRRRKETLIDV